MAFVISLCENDTVFFQAVSYFNTASLSLYYFIYHKTALNVENENGFDADETTRPKKTFTNTKRSLKIQKFFQHHNRKWDDQINNLML